MAPENDRVKSPRSAFDVASAALPMEENEGRDLQ
jgi:hypothetical protein